MKVIFDKPLRFRKIILSKEERKTLEPWLRDSTIWMNTDGYRLLLAGDELPNIGSAVDVVLRSHTDKRHSDPLLGLPQSFRKKHVVMCLGQTGGVAETRTLSEMIESGYISNEEQSREASSV